MILMKLKLWRQVSHCIFHSTHLIKTPDSFRKMHFNEWIIELMTHLINSHLDSFIIPNTTVMLSPAVAK